MSKTRLPGRKKLDEGIRREEAVEVAAGDVAAMAAELVAQRLVGAASAAEALEQGDQSDMVPLDRQLYSIGQVCQRLGLPPGNVRHIMRGLGVEFVQSINNTPYVDGFGLLELYRVINKARQIEAAGASQE